MKALEHFEGLLANTVNLNPDRLEQLDGRVESIFACLDNDDELGPLVHEYIAQGSWAHSTIIKPVGLKEFDADLLLVLTEVPGKEPKDYLRDVAAALRRSNHYNNIVTQKTRCVRVMYANFCHVDIVPYLERVQGGVIVNKTLNSFEPSNPSGFTEWMRSKDEAANGQLRKVIRILKYLRDYKGTFSVPSVILTTLVGERVSTWDTTLHPDTPTALRQLLGDLADWLDLHSTMPTIFDPSCPTTSFNHRWDEARYANFAKWIRYYADKVTSAYDEPDWDASLALWRDVFGDDFKKRASTTPAVRAAGGLDVRVPGEVFIEERFPRSETSCPARITATLTNKKGFRSGSLRSMGSRVPKDRSIVFTLGHNARGPVSIFWKVRNGGDEAANIPGGLRGEITADDGSSSRTETTLYRGEHYVEAYVVQNGMVVATARHPIRVI